MCGIVGVLSRTGTAPPADRLRGLLPLLDHRGPDDRGSIVLGSACFGHTRLSILGLDAPAARQPVCSGGHMLVFNGEIYNFHDLVDALRGAGISIDGRSDTEALFLSLAHWGLDRTLARIDGMFAFAWFDGQARKLHLVRDPMGEKFLYWADTPKEFWFASEIKPLIAAGAATCAPNLRRIDDFFYTGKINGAETIFRDVREVEPGTVVAVSADSAPRDRTWWSLTDQAQGAADDVRSFPERLTHAIASRRISDVPIGILLSGGIDSNALVELLLAQSPRDDLDLFFADNVNPRMSEKADAELFVDHMRVRYPAGTLRFHPSLIEFDEYQSRMAEITWYYDEPIQFANSPLLHRLCEDARRANLKVLLSGEGSDEILYGYERFARTRAELEGISDRRTIVEALYFGGGRHSTDLVRRLTRDVAQGAAATAPWSWIENHLDDFGVDRFQLLFSQRYRLQTLLQRQDRIGMAHSIEIRVPYLAPALVSSCNRLPIDELYDPSSGETKRPLRRFMAGRLPQRILTKAKDGFPSDMLGWLREERMQRHVSELVGDPSGFCQRFLDGECAKQIVADHFSGQRRADVLVWELYSLETWHRVFRNGVEAPKESIAAVN
jgi:asparagine synthase (glutamine-hydrolysing)